MSQIIHILILLTYLLNIEEKLLLRGRSLTALEAGCMRSPKLEKVRERLRNPHGQDLGTYVALAIAWDNLQGEERRFEPIVIMGEDPVREMDKFELL